jgi:hypothetical protein
MMNNSYKSDSYNLLERVHGTFGNFLQKPWLQFHQCHPGDAQ